MRPLLRNRLLLALPLSALAMSVALPAAAGGEGTTGDGGGATTVEPDAPPPTGSEATASQDEAGVSTDPETSRTTAAEPGDGEATTTSKRRRLGDRTLRRGMRGSDVRHLQKVLTELNFKTRVSGRYGRLTKRGVRRYDRWKERTVNGVVHMQQAGRMKKMVRAGRRYRKHVFPVRGPHNYGGAGSRFGAPRSGRTHQGQDVAAAEGTRLVAVHEGRVAYKQYQAGGAGHYLVIHGKDGSDSVYMHLREPARLGPGSRVMAGQVIGRVGTTGSSTGPHLHFELWTRHWYAGGSPYDPLSKLQRWDRRT